jgi:hypothetical protein
VLAAEPARPPGVFEISGTLLERAALRRPFFIPADRVSKCGSCQSFEEEPIDHWCNFYIAPSIET